MNHPADPFILSRRTERPDRLALMLSGRTDIDAAFVLRQVEGWQRLRTKVPSWAAIDQLLYPPRLSLEQCSGEAAARYKAALAARLEPDGGTLADLTGGLGVDFAFMARHFARAIYVERRPELCRLARHNFPLLGLPAAEIVEADATEHLDRLPDVALTMLDPARRDSGGRKTVFIEDCEPNVVAIMPRLLAKSHTVLLKLSPMLDADHAVHALGNVAEVHAVAVAGECRELLLVLRSGAATPYIYASEDGRTLRFTRREEAEARPEYAAELAAYLYEPGAALLKAGAFRLTAVRFGLKKLHPNSHLYTADRLVPDFPGRVFCVQRYTGFGKRELRDFCTGVPAANLTVRNFPASVADLRRRLRLKEGGVATWFATTLSDGRHVLIDCRHVPSGDALPAAAERQKTV